MPASRSSSSSPYGILIVAGMAAMASMAAAETRWTIETGLVVGGRVGRIVGPTHSSIRAVTDFGFLRTGARSPDAPAGAGWGVVFHGALGGDDMRLGVKARIRVPLNREWSAEPSSGILFGVIEGDPRVSSSGFVGGLSLQRSSAFSLRGDVEVVHVDRYWIVQENVPRYRGPGHEVSVYGGVTLRERAGWIATASGALAMGAVLLLFLLSGGAS
jgi:hypothetical protein